ncbi:hypothetical protein L3Q82_018503, partial [Scortum barcoo]
AQGLWEMVFIRKPRKKEMLFVLMFDFLWRLERRWILWHEFMTEHAHLDTWLRLAEQAVSSPNPAHITYVATKEGLRKFERLRSEAGSLLVLLDSLTQRNRTLTRLFQGAMKARLLASARECGQRWDDVTAKLESIIGKLKLFISEWEGFEAEREELALWLDDLDVRLTEVDHLSGNTCEKLLQLQVFEDDWILSQATDSGCPSESLLEEEGNKTNLDLLAASNHPKDFSQSANTSLDFTFDPPSPVHLPPLPPSPSSPSHEHLGLEWDPSVDIGRSVSRDDADSSYFSASIGVCRRDGVKRRRYLSSLGSQSDISNDVTNREADLVRLKRVYYLFPVQRVEGWLDRAHPSIFSPVATEPGGTRLNGDEWATSTPDRRDGNPVSFDGGRVRAWLGVQSSAPPERRTSCCKAVQTDGEVEFYLNGNHIDAPNQPLRLNNSQSRRDDKQLFPGPAPSPSHDLTASSNWMKHHPINLEFSVFSETQKCCLKLQRINRRSLFFRSKKRSPVVKKLSVFSPNRSEETQKPSEFVTSSSRPSSSSPLSPALLYLLLAAALALLACLIWVVLEPPCQRSGRMPRSFHLTLRYVNGPPPT